MWLRLHEEYNVQICSYTIYAYNIHRYIVYNDNYESNVDKIIKAGSTLT